MSSYNIYLLPYLLLCDFSDGHISPQFMISKGNTAGDTSLVALSGVYLQILPKAPDRVATFLEKQYVGAGALATIFPPQYSYPELLNKVTKTTYKTIIKVKAA